MDIFQDFLFLLFSFHKEILHYFQSIFKEPFLFIWLQEETTYFLNVFRRTLFFILFIGDNFLQNMFFLFLLHWTTFFNFCQQYLFSFFLLHFECTGFRVSIKKWLSFSPIFFRIWKSFLFALFINFFLTKKYENRIQITLTY